MHTITSNRIRVFISSSMNEELYLERRAAIKSFFDRDMKMFECFLIERTASPSDVRTRFSVKVRWSDVVVIILANEAVRDAVKEEFQIAIDNKKKIFVFIESPRENEELLTYIDEFVKDNSVYCDYFNLETLINKIEESLLDDLAESYRDSILSRAIKPKANLENLEGNS